MPWGNVEGGHSRFNHDIHEDELSTWMNLTKSSVINLNALLA
jgi:hypothetical protein